MYFSNNSSGSRKRKQRKVPGRIRVEYAFRSVASPPIVGFSICSSRQACVGARIFESGSAMKLSSPGNRLGDGEAWNR